MSEQQPTPRTDAVDSKPHQGPLFHLAEMRKEARTLECELAEACDEIKELVYRLKNLDSTNPEIARAEELLGRIGK